MRRLLAIVCTLCMLTAAHALDYPTKNVNAIVAYNPGGATDLSNRAVLDNIPPGILPPGVSFVVVNMPGGSGLVGMNHFFRQRKDGYTLGAVNCDLVLNYVRGATNLKPADFVPLIFVQADPYLILVKKDSPFKKIQDLIDYMKARPGEVVIADSGPGAVPYMAVVAIDKAVGAKAKSVSYDNSLECCIAVVNGEAVATVSHASAAAGQIDAGEIVPLAVTSNKRLSLFPDVPAFGEIYPEASDMQILSWVTISALAGTDPAIITYLQETFRKAAATDGFKNVMKRLYSQDPSGMNDAEMRQFFSDQENYYRKLLK